MYNICTGVCVCAHVYISCVYMYNQRKETRTYKDPSPHVHLSTPGHPMENPWRPRAPYPA